MPKQTKNTDKQGYADKIKKSFQTRLEDLLSEAKEMGKKSARQIGAESGVGYSAISKYANSAAEAGISSLCRLADYFGVTTDYLLGRSNVSKLDPKLQEICAYTGLSEKAVAKLHLLKEGKRVEYYSNYGEVKAVGASFIPLFYNPQPFLQLLDLLLCDTEKVTELGFSLSQISDYKRRLESASDEDYRNLFSYSEPNDEKNNTLLIKTSIIDGLSSYVMRARDELDDCVNSIFEETLSIYQNRKEDLEG